jgi:lysophospholipase L1-like esterase
MRPTSCITAIVGLVLALSRPSWGEPAPKPVVVLIGDSIRLGYAPAVAERLKDVAEVVSTKANGGDSGNVLKHLDTWAIEHKPAVVHVNAGLHDIKSDPKTGAHQVEIRAYEANLRAILSRLERSTSARIIVATSTPVIESRRDQSKPYLLREADVEAYNRAALAVVKATHAAAVDDLHALVVRLGPDRVLGADGVHFTKEGYEALADQVASEVRRALHEPRATREATCRWAETAPVLDGKLDDPAWASAAVIEDFPAFWDRAETGTGTRARLVWDDRALYFSATMTDAELRAAGTRRNDRLWLGDVFELFFKPTAERPEYYEFQVNPRSVILELAFPERGSDFATLAARPPMGMEAVATTDGTLDQPGDRDRGWTVEGRIPWSVFAPSGGRPAPGSSWRFALCRYDYGPEGTEPVMMSSAPLTRRSFHRYEDYGLLRFEGPRR